MSERYVVESDWDRECDYLMDSEHPGYANRDNCYDSDAVVVVISYDCPEDITFNRALKPLVDLLNQQDSDIKAALAAIDALGKYYD